MLSIAAKIFGNFDKEIHGKLRPAWEFTGQNGPTPEVVLFDRLVQSDQNYPSICGTKLSNRKWTLRSGSKLRALSIQPKLLVGIFGNWQ